MVTLTNSTIVANRGGTTSHNYAIRSGTLNIKNTIIADRYNTSVSDFVINSGTVNDGGSNIIETQSASTFTNGVKGDLVGDQASLNISASLALNSATNGIKTLALSSGSIAIDAGTSTSHNNISVPSTDARELNRGATVDIGAFEYGAENPDSNAPAVELTAPSSGATVTGSSVTVTASSSDNVGVSGVKFYYGATLIGSEDTASPFSVTWDTTATSSGSKTLVAVARDAAGNVATSSAVTVTVSNTPTAETPTVSRGNNSASFSWNTGKAGSTKLYFGLTSSLATSTAESNTGGSATTTHSVSLSNLPKCTTYKYVLVNRSVGNVDVSTSTERTFYTACTGSATVSAYEQEELSAASGGTLTHDTLTLTVPAGFAADASSTAVFQASTIDASSVTSAVGTPSNKTRFGNIYHLASLSSDTETLDSFEEPITIKLSYSGQSDVDTSSLFIGRYDGSSWYALSSTVNTSDQTVTATTSAFSDIGLFGDESEETTATMTAIQTGSTIFSRIEAAIKNNDISLAVELLRQLIVQLTSGLGLEKKTDSYSAAEARPTTANSLIFVRDLWLKDEGEDVRVLQQFLIESGYPIRTGPTGYFGEITREALASYQSDKGIHPAGGYFGAKTRDFLAGHTRQQMATAPSN